MDEKDLAADLQATKDDPGEWGEPSPRATDGETAVDSAGDEGPKRRLAAMVSVRLSPDELEAVQGRAGQRGESVSAYLRGLALRDIALSTTPFHFESLISSGQPYVSRVTGSLVVNDGAWLLTRAS